MLAVLNFLATPSRYSPLTSEILWLTPSYKDCMRKFVVYHNSTYFTNTCFSTSKIH